MWWEVRRKALYIMITLCMILVATSVYFIFIEWSKMAKFISLSGIMMDITGVVQLRFSGFFEKMLEPFRDEDKFPSGPPSNITRNYIYKYWSPDHPIRSAIRYEMHYNPKVGFLLIISGFALQFFGTAAA